MLVGQRTVKTKADVADRAALLRPAALGKWLLAPPDAMAPKAAVNSQHHRLVVGRQHTDRAVARARARLPAASPPTFTQHLFDRRGGAEERGPPRSGSAALGTLMFWAEREEPPSSHTAVLTPPRDVLYGQVPPAFWVTFGRERSRFAQSFGRVAAAPPVASA